MRAKKHRSSVLGLANKDKNTKKHFPPFTHYQKYFSTLLAKQKQKSTDWTHTSHFSSYGFNPPPYTHPTKKTGGETNQNQQKDLTTFTEDDTMVHYKTKGGVICVQRVLLIS